MITLVNGEVKLNDTFLANKNIKKLVARDRGGVMKGDSVGKLKLRAIAELGLVWYRHNLNSPGVQKGLSGEDLDTDGKDFFNIPDEWKEDDIFKIVNQEYKDTYDSSVVVRSIKSLLSGFNRSLGLTNTISDMLNKLSNDDSNGEMTIDKVSEFIKLNKELMNVSSDIPNQIKSLKSLEGVYLKEEAKATTGRGGVAIVESMKPNRT